MECIFPNNHVVAVVDGKNYIVDLGSPVSFSFDRSKSIEIDGVEYKFTSPIALTRKSDVRKLTGIDVAGFIGNDIITRTGLTINKSEGTIDFDFDQGKWEGATSLPISELRMSIMSYLVADVIINNNLVLGTILDTGAKISYVNKRYLRDEDKTGEKFEDFSPEIGKIKGELYMADVSAQAGETVQLKVGEMPGLLARMGLNAIINPMEFAHEKLGININERRMYYR